MSPRRIAGAVPLVGVALTLGACVAQGPVIEPMIGEGAPERVELDRTPFFPQQQYQCGPAALATVLATAGVAVTPEALVPEVYLPGRHGSLQPELVAAVRRHDRVPYLLPPSAEVLFATVAAGRPVLLLQKLGAGPVPGWHYAVLVGYDASHDRVVLRSGTERRKAMPAAHFLASWDRGGRWALVALPPGELPPQADFARYMAAIAGLEAVGRIDAAAPAYAAAAREWPDAALPRLALANLAYARGDLVAAERGFHEAARLDPTDVAARNNRAEVLRQLDCGALARREVDAARRLAGDGPLASTVEATALDVALQPDRDAAGCPPD